MSSSTCNDASESAAASIRQEIAHGFDVASFESSHGLSLVQLVSDATKSAIIAASLLGVDKLGLITTPSCKPLSYEERQVANFLSHGVQHLSNPTNLKTTVNLRDTVLRSYLLLSYDATSSTSEKNAWKNIVQPQVLSPTFADGVAQNMELLQANNCAGGYDGNWTLNSHATFLTLMQQVQNQTNIHAASASVSSSSLRSELDSLIQDGVSGRITFAELASLKESVKGKILSGITVDSKYIFRRFWHGTENCELLDGAAGASSLTGETAGMPIVFDWGCFKETDFAIFLEDIAGKIHAFIVLAGLILSTIISLTNNNLWYEWATGRKRMETVLDATWSYHTNVESYATGMGDVGNNNSSTPDSDSDWGVVLAGTPRGSPERAVSVDSAERAISVSSPRGVSATKIKVKLEFKQRPGSPEPTAEIPAYPSTENTGVLVNIDDEIPSDLDAFFEGKHEMESTTLSPLRLPLSPETSRKRLTTSQKKITFEALHRQIFKSGLSYEYQMTIQQVTEKKFRKAHSATNVPQLDLARAEILRKRRMSEEDPAQRKYRPTDAALKFYLLRRGCDVSALKPHEQDALNAILAAQQDDVPNLESFKRTQKKLLSSIPDHVVRAQDKRKIKGGVKEGAVKKKKKQDWREIVAEMEAAETWCDSCRVMEKTLSPKSPNGAQSSDSKKESPMSNKYGKSSPNSPNQAETNSKIPLGKDDKLSEGDPDLRSKFWQTLVRGGDMAENLEEFEQRYTEELTHATKFNDFARDGKIFVMPHPTSIQMASNDYGKSLGRIRYLMQNLGFTWHFPSFVAQRYPDFLVRIYLLMFADLFLHVFVLYHSFYPRLSFFPADYWFSTLPSDYNYRNPRKIFLRTLYIYLFNTLLYVPLLTAFEANSLAGNFSIVLWLCCFIGWQGWYSVSAILSLTGSRYGGAGVVIFLSKLFIVMLGCQILVKFCLRLWQNLQRTDGFGVGLLQKLADSRSEKWIKFVMCATSGNNTEVEDSTVESGLAEIHRQRFSKPYEGTMALDGKYFDRIPFHLGRSSFLSVGNRYHSESIAEMRFVKENHSLTSGVSSGELHIVDAPMSSGKEAKHSSIDRGIVQPKVVSTSFTSKLLGSREETGPLLLAEHQPDESLYRGYVQCYSVQYRDTHKLLHREENDQQTMTEKRRLMTFLNYVQDLFAGGACTNSADERSKWPSPMLQLATYTTIVLMIFSTIGWYTYVANGLLSVYDLLDWHSDFPDMFLERIIVDVLGLHSYSLVADGKASTSGSWIKVVLWCARCSSFIAGIFAVLCVILLLVQYVTTISQDLRDLRVGNASKGYLEWCKTTLFDGSSASAISTPYVFCSHLIVHIIVRFMIALVVWSLLIFITVWFVWIPIFRLGVDSGVSDVLMDNLCDVFLYLFLPLSVLFIFRAGLHYTMDRRFIETERWSNTIGGSGGESDIRASQVKSISVVVAMKDHMLTWLRRRTDGEQGRSLPEIQTVSSWSPKLEFLMRFHCFVFQMCSLVLHIAGVILGVFWRMVSPLMLFPSGEDTKDTYGNYSDALTSLLRTSSYFEFLHSFRTDARNNRSVVTFCQLLLVETAGGRRYRRRILDSTSGESHIELRFQKNEGSERLQIAKSNARRRGRVRWMLCYTLVRNPVLMQWRKRKGSMAPWSLRNTGTSFVSHEGR